MFQFIRYNDSNHFIDGFPYLRYLQPSVTHITIAQQFDGENESM